MLRKILAFAIVGFVVAASLISAPSFENHGADAQATRPGGAAIASGP